MLSMFICVTGREAVYERQTKFYILHPMQSIFTDKKKQPADADLEKALGSTCKFWKELEAYTHKADPGATGAWHYSGDKFGWSFRISDKKRVLVYLLPRDAFFKVAFVFGQKATDEVLTSDVPDAIKKELREAKVYAEGRGIRIDVKSKAIVGSIKKLIDCKIAH